MHATSARRVLLVVSPESLSTGWTESSVGQLLKQLIGLPARAIVVTLRELPAAVKLPVNKADPVGKAADLLLWQGSHERRFWYQLRLALPPSRPSTGAISSDSQVAMIVHQADVKPGQHKARSRESLEVLV